MGRKRKEVEPSSVVEFDLSGDDSPYSGGIEDAAAIEAAPDGKIVPLPKKLSESVEEWADGQLKVNQGVAVFDIETGAIAEEKLRALYSEPTLDEFAADCDQRWKPETVQAKWEEAKVKGWQKFQDKAALSWLTGRVVAVGVAALPDAPIICGAVDQTDESERYVLDQFWQWVVKMLAERRSIVGHNSANFDLPFLTMRSRLHHIDIPWEILQMSPRGPQWNNRFVDTMKVSTFGQYGQFMSLDKLAKFFGFAGKSEGCTGADFARLWYGTDEEHAKAIEYLTQDVSLTGQIAGALMIC